MNPGSPFGVGAVGNTLVVPLTQNRLFTSARQRVMLIAAASRPLKTRPVPGPSTHMK
jgi:hypothetical protein